jgi:hypothetical protein
VLDLLQMAEYIRNERNVLDKLHHPGVAALHFTFQVSVAKGVGASLCAQAVSFSAYMMAAAAAEAQLPRQCVWQPGCITQVLQPCTSSSRLAQYSTRYGITARCCQPPPIQYQSSSTL